MLDSLGRLLSCKYWERIWVVQEIILARDIVLYCGDNSMKGEDLYAVQQLLVRISRRDGFSTDLLDAVLPGKPWDRFFLLDLGIKRFYEWKHEVISTKPSFFNCMLRHFNKIASDPRDMIYGLAALANQTSQYKVEVDYNLPTSVVFTNFARLEIESSKKLDVTTRVLPGYNIYNLPSWAPDWSRGAGRAIGHEHLYDTLPPELTFYSAGQSEADVAFNGDIMTFKGIIIGSIDLLSKRTNMTDRVSGDIRQKKGYISTSHFMGNGCQNGWSIRQRA
jgi:hypothetical protein